MPASSPSPLTIEPSLPRAVAILGPTAAGKSALALECARRWGQSIVSCDSVQVYRGLDIGSAKPEVALRDSQAHYLVDCVAPDESFSAGDYVRLALPLLRRERCIIAGGTGLYLRSLALTQTQALAQLDSDPRARRERLEFDAQWGRREGQSPGCAHAALKALDAETAGEIHPRNVVRVLRALWLCERLGRPISALRREDPPRPRLSLFVVVLDPGQETLAARIAQRCEAMFEAGWLEEVQGLLARGVLASSPAMSCMGYRQLCEHLDGQRSLREAKSAIIHDTTQYARRQRTYFRHQLPSGPTRWIARAQDFPWQEAGEFLREGSQR